jgi:uncharacterized protein involved in exopolysaccharide biosynthesis
MHDESKAPKEKESELTLGKAFESNMMISAVVRRWRLFLTIFCSAFLLAATAIFSLPKQYEAQMKLLVKNERKDLVVSPDNGSTMHTNELTETQVNSEIELLRSKDVLREVVLEAHLEQQEPGTVLAAGPASPISVDQALRVLEKRLTVTPVKKSNIIEISYSAADPEMASSVLKRLADSYLGTHLKVHGTPGTYSFFERQAGAYKERLSHAEQELRSFGEKYSALVMPEEKDILMTRAVEAQATLEDTEAQIADYQQRVAQDRNNIATLQQRVLTQERTSPQQALVGRLNEMLAELRNRRTELETKFRSDDRLVVEIRKEIAETSAALERALAQDSTEKETDINPVRQNAEKELVTAEAVLSGLEARRGRLGAIVNEYRQRMFSLADATVKHDALTRQVKENEDNYLLYEKKREEARIAESLDQQRITNVAIVQAPTTPVQPASPRIKLDLLLAAMCSVFMAVMVVTLLELLVPSQPRAVRQRIVAAAAIA